MLKRLFCCRCFQNNTKTLKSNPRSTKSSHQQPTSQSKNTQPSPRKPTQTQPTTSRTNPRYVPSITDEVQLQSTNEPIVTNSSSCRCHISPEDRKKESSSYLGCWLHNGIRDEELVDFLSDNFLHLQPSGELQNIDYTSLNEVRDTGSVWNEFQRTKQCTAFRRQLPSGLYEYRVHASFNDISASQLIRTNTDIEYRKTWDGYVVELEVLDSDADSSTELIHWIIRCPYPFGTREYIYLRRQHIDHKDKLMVLIQKITDETDIPVNQKVTRVDTYVSNVIIKSHEGRELNEKGCDYLITYFDDPKISVPTRIMDMAAAKGISDSVKRMHNAALELPSDDVEKGQTPFPLPTAPPSPIVRRPIPLPTISEHNTPSPDDSSLGEPPCTCHISFLDQRKESYSYLGCWLHNGIRKEELDNFLTENVIHLQTSGNLQKIECASLNRNLIRGDQWKEFQRNKLCTTFRRKLPTGLFEYRVHASFDDISAVQLTKACMDIDYRKTWDNYVVELKTVDTDKETSTELIHWVTRCPYPFATREYVYLRRHSVHMDNKTIVILQKTTNDTDIPTPSKVTRVEEYMSKCIIKSHRGKELEENGCGYLITYFDDPKMVVPSRVMDLAVGKGISDSVRRLYKAALALTSLSLIVGQLE